eukprot:38668-Eustigmatos_ZCMA.PRE.1
MPPLSGFTTIVLQARFFSLITAPSNSFSTATRGNLKVPFSAFTLFLKYAGAASTRLRLACRRVRAHIAP